jgi:nicotinamidase-related amidase
MRRGTEVGRAELAHRVAGAKLDPSRAALVVIDIQEAFRKAVPVFDDVARAAGVLVEGAKVVGTPIAITEQYPKGLGHTVPEVAEHLPKGADPIEKVVFSAVEADGFDLGGADQVLVCGIETHVCVNQTVIDLLAGGVDVHVAEDAVGSRSKQNWRLGLEKVERAGATLTSVETALFELVRRAGTDEFKQVQKLILEYAP